MGFPLNTRSGGGTQATDAQRLGGTQRHQVLVPVPLVVIIIILLSPNPSSTSYCCSSTLCEETEAPDVPYLFKTPAALMRLIQHTNPDWTFLRKLQGGWTSARTEEGRRKLQIQGGPCSRTRGPRTTCAWHVWKQKGS